MGLFDSLKNLASDMLGDNLGNAVNGVVGQLADGQFDLGAAGDLPAVIGEHFNADQLGEIAQVAGDHLNAVQLDDLTALAEENISADQIGSVAGMIQEQGANLDLESIAEQAGLPGDVIGQISGLLGR